VYAHACGAAMLKSIICQFQNSFAAWVDAIQQVYEVLSILNHSKVRKQPEDSVLVALRKDLYGRCDAAINALLCLLY
jgi:hypothetical protein